MDTGRFDTRLTGFGASGGRFCGASGEGVRTGKFVGKWHSSIFKRPHAHGRPADGHTLACLLSWWHVRVSFSMASARMWQGGWGQFGGERISPCVSQRLAARRHPSSLPFLVASGCLTVGFPVPSDVPCRQQELEGLKAPASTVADLHRVARGEIDTDEVVRNIYNRVQNVPLLRS